jgi:hypothetical protein
MRSDILSQGLQVLPVRVPCSRQSPNEEGETETMNCNTGIFLLSFCQCNHANLLIAAACAWSLAMLRPSSYVGSDDLKIEVKSTEGRGSPGGFSTTLIPVLDGMHCLLTVVFQ